MNTSQKIDKKMGIVIGSDFGGTNLRVALIETHGKILTQHIEKTSFSDTNQLIIEKITGQFQKIIASAPEKPLAIGIAAAGLVDSTQKKIVFSPHIPGFENLPLGEIIENQFNIPVVIENDASAAALGEYTFGASQGYRNTLHATLGTGIGGGIIIDGELYKGKDGLAGEIGHLVFNPSGKQCKCGSRGCLETLASGSAFADQAQVLISDGQAPILESIAQSQKPTAKMLYAAAIKDEKVAIETIQKGGQLIGLGLVSLINTLNPDIVTLSGGLLNMGDLLIGPLRKIIQIQKYGPAQQTPIIETQLGENCGLLGAAALALNKLDVSHRA